MANGTRSFTPSPSPQPLFRQVRAADRTASALAGVQQEADTALQKNLENKYQELANQYESNQITDGQFVDSLQVMVGGIDIPSLKNAWGSTLGEARYMVLANAQDIEHKRIQAGLASGALSVQDAIARYNAMGDAAQLQNSKSAIRDAESWRLQAAQLQEVARRSSGSGRGSSSKELDEEDIRNLKLKYEEEAASLNNERQQMQADLQYYQGLVKSGDMTEADYEGVRQEYLNGYTASVQDFAYSKDVMNYVYDVDPVGGTGFLNEQLGFTKSVSGKIPPIPSFYQDSISSDIMGRADDLSTDEIIRSREATATRSLAESENSYQEAVQSRDFAEQAKQSLFSRVSAPPTLASSETQRRSDPLSLGTNFTGGV